MTLAHGLFVALTVWAGINSALIAGLVWAFLQQIREDRAVQRQLDAAATHFAAWETELDDLDGHYRGTPKC